MPWTKILNPGTTYMVNGRPMIYRFKLMVQRATVNEYWFFDNNGFSTALLEHEMTHRRISL